MPTSDPWNIPHVVDLAQRVRPRKVLDVGVGFGKYGLLLREYLDVWEERYGPEDWRVEIHGIEAYGAYANPVWDAVYDSVLRVDVEAWLRDPPGEPYDLCLLCDVLEHFDREAGERVLEGLLGRCRTVLVTTPLRFHPQEDVHGNPWERHRSVWGRADFSRWHPVFRETPTCLVALLSHDRLPDDLRYRLAGRWRRRWMRFTSALAGMGPTSLR